MITFSVVDDTRFNDWTFVRFSAFNTSLIISVTSLFVIFDTQIIIIRSRTFELLPLELETFKPVKTSVIRVPTGSISIKIACRRFETKVNAVRVHIFQRK